MEILIAEDDYISRSLLRKMLTEMGHRVVETENGQQAWDLLQRRPLQVVVTDWMMPEMDGLALCRNIRKAPFDGYVYVIVLTAKDRKKDLVEVFQSGADDYIPKPFDPEELKARVLTGLRVIDLEERHRRMQNSLMDSRNKIKSIIDALPEQIVTLDREFKIVSVNKAFCDDVRIKADKLAGRHCFGLAADLTDCPWLSKIEPLVKTAFETGTSQQLLYTRTDENGQTGYRRIDCFAGQDDGGRVNQVLMVNKDVSDEHRKTEEIKALNAQLSETGEELANKKLNLQATLKQLETTQAQMLQSEKMAAIGQLAAGVAHEINNPTGFVDNNLKTLEDYQKEIGALIGKYREFLEAMRTENASEQLGEVLKAQGDAISRLENEIRIDFLLSDTTDLINDCREGTRRIKKIVQDLKSFVHPGEDKLQTVDINSGLVSTLNVVNSEIKYKAKVETDFGQIPTVNGYPQQLNQAFMNLLVNAAQAIDKKGIIKVKTQAVNGWVEVAISDTGCGIAQENISKIFDPFFTTKEVGKGTGLGLNIVNSIIKKHHGVIHVDSTVGQGATFTLRLPVES